MFFVLGLFAGIFVFGETIDSLLSDFWNSSYMGRFTLPELFSVPTGYVVLAIVVVAIFLFWGAEKVEAMMGGEKPKKSQTKYKLAGAGVLIAAALAVVIIGQPTPQDRWEWIAAEKQPLLENRAVYIHPAELLDYIYNDRVDVVMLDVRDETDYNLFHIEDARRVSLDELPQLSEELLQKPANTLFVVMSNGETRATEAWKILVAESLTNVYILEGGINNWLATFNIEPDEEGVAVAMAPVPVTPPPPGDEVLHYKFPAALGAQYPAAYPDPHEFEDIEYTPKVKLEIKQATGGG
ncbi:MAG: rhodanese-like domain-containing protein [Chloroflexi bacterium]|nr:MAG: rhodanese-like domain-containing protein [Chloroflexota bacterium]